MPLELIQDRIRSAFIPKLARSSGEREFLPAALEIMESPPSPAGRLVAWVIAAAVFFAIIWACVGSIDIIATAPGKIVPVGKTKIVQPFDVSAVSAIRVADGDHVRAGQILVELDKTQAIADNARYIRDLERARLDLSRSRGLWDALESGGTASLIGPPSDASAAELESAYTGMVAEQDEQAEKVADLKQQIAEKTAEIAAAGNSVARYQASLPYVQKQADLRDQLMKLQFGNRLSYLQSEQALVEQQQQILVLRSQQDQASAEQRALVQKREEAINDYKKTLLDELDKAQNEVSMLDAESTKARKALEFKTLRAPIDGTVQELGIHTVGGVVTPAQQLMIIVPNNASLTVEAMVGNQDVGFVHAGQDAKVKIGTFNFTRYGLIDGKVTSLSHDTVTQNQQTTKDQGRVGDKGAAPDTQDAAYVAHIQLTRNWMETETGRVALGPGMEVTAEIHTGRRKIIDYLLSPLKSELDEGLHER